MTVMAQTDAELPRATAASGSKVFDIGIHGRLSLSQFLLIGFQNVFGMTGMFVFPGLLGRSFNLPLEQIAYLYGMTFLVCGVITILQSVFLLRLPIIQGPYAGSFAALLAVGHLEKGGLGAAYGSFFVASLIWCLLTVSIGGFSVIGLVARYLRSPIVSGMIVVLTMIQISNVALPNWIGLPVSPGYPLINLGAGAVAVVALVAVTLWGGQQLRRGAVLIALALGAACYMLFRPLAFGGVIAAPWLVTPHWFPFGFEVQAELVAIFLLTLIPAGLGSIAMYQIVADWGNEPVSDARMAGGVFGVAIGSVLAGIVGGFSTLVYPDNVGMLRSTRVGSRYGTLAAGLLLIVLGSCVKFDMLLVIVPNAVLSAAATLLFGIVFIHGVHMLASVEWDDRNLIIAGLAAMIGLGGLFVAPEVMNAMPLIMQLVLRQPVVSGGLTVIVLHALLARRHAAVTTVGTRH